jgi:hypothetical protein
MSAWVEAADFCEKRALPNGRKGYPDSGQDTVPDRANLNASLAVFRLWYNHVRTHQHLQGQTSVEVWNGVDVRKRPIRRVWFEAWDGLLQGEYLQR